MGILDDFDIAIRKSRENNAANVRSVTLVIYICSSS